jgi:hypothetical protein
VARLLLFIVIPFKLWMLYDAWERRAETYWLYAILLVPGGAVAYFVLVRLRDSDARRMQSRLLNAMKRPESLDKLRHRYERSPTIASRIVLAQALGDAEQWAEAREHFQGVLERRPEEHDALFGLGVCELELGNLDAAAGAFEKLEALNPAYRDFAVYPELAVTYERQGDIAKSIELLRLLVRREPRLRHAVLLAERLVQVGERDEARELLGEALTDHEDAPRYVRRTNRRWARRASALLEQLRSAAA